MQNTKNFYRLLLVWSQVTKYGGSLAPEFSFLKFSVATRRAFYGLQNVDDTPPLGSRQTNSNE
jgi:hypothetical protein